MGYCTAPFKNACIIVYGIIIIHEMRRDSGNAAEVAVYQKMSLEDKLHGDLHDSRIEGARNLTEIAGSGKRCVHSEQAGCQP